MTQVLTEIINILVGGLTSFATGFGSGLTALVSSIFLDTTGDTTKLSTMGGLIVIFAATSLCIGMSRWVVNFCASLGARNR